MPLTYSDYLIEGAQKLSTVDFGLSVKEGLWDATYWERSGYNWRGIKILRLKPGTSPTTAVEAIFDNPHLWSFDCSQFCQVVNFYAQMKTLNASDPGAFDRTILAHGNRLEIKPFQGAFFTVRQHYYRRESQSEWMKYSPNPPHVPYEATRIPAWDLVRAAPVGTRVNFNVGAGGAFDFENTIKANMNPLKFTAQGLGSTKVWDHDDLLIKLAKVKDPSVGTLADAARIIWIKEVSIFKHLPLPPHRAP
jgi:hypothetical protein